MVYQFELSKRTRERLDKVGYEVKANAFVWDEVFSVLLDLWDAQGYGDKRNECRSCGMPCDDIFCVECGYAEIHEVGKYHGEDEPNKEEVDDERV